MAVYDLEEQEQIDEMKAWWATHGNWVTAVVVAASLAVVGWQGWNWYQNKQSAESSAIFFALQQAEQAGDAARIKSLTGELTEKYSGTTQAALATLIAAKSSLAVEDSKTARAQLTWAAEHANDEIRALARVRLAGLLLDEKAYDDALKVLDQEKLPVFALQVLGLRGDVLLAQGKRKEARGAYEAALDAAHKKDMGSDEGGADRPWLQLLQQKRDALGDAV